LEGGPPRFPRDSQCPVVLRSAAEEVHALLPTGLSPCVARRSRTVRLTHGLVTSRPDRSPVQRHPTTPRRQRLRAITPARFGLFPFRSPLLRESRRFLLLPVLRCFSSRACLHTAYVFSDGSRGMTRGGFPHSETAGSKVARHLPGPFAADSVLHRPLAPGHPPCACCSLSYPP